MHTHAHTHVCGLTCWQSMRVRSVAREGGMLIFNHYSKWLHSMLKRFEPEKPYYVRTWGGPNDSYRHRSHFRELQSRKWIEQREYRANAWQQNNVWNSFDILFVSLGKSIIHLTLAKTTTATTKKLAWFNDLLKFLSSPYGERPTSCFCTSQILFDRLQ